MIDRSIYAAALDEIADLRAKLIAAREEHQRLAAIVAAHGECAQAIADATIRHDKRPSLTWHRATAEAAAVRSILYCAGTP